MQNDYMFLYKLSIYLDFPRLHASHIVHQQQLPYVKPTNEVLSLPLTEAIGR